MEILFNFNITRLPLLSLFMSIVTTICHLNYPMTIGYTRVVNAALELVPLIACKTLLSHYCGCR